jgi:hypothetical protein
MGSSQGMTIVIRSGFASAVVLVLLVGTSCSHPWMRGEPLPPDGFVAPEHQGDVWRVTSSGVEDSEESAVTRALLVARGELLALREVRVGERLELVFDFHYETGGTSFDSSTLHQDILISTHGDLRGSRELSDRRRVELRPDGQVKATVTVEIAHDDLFPETRMQELLERVPRAERAPALVDLSREYALDGFPGMASVALEAAESAAADDGQALLDVADLLLEQGDRAQALRLNERARASLAADDPAVGRAEVQHARLLASVAPLSRQRFELERLTRLTWRPRVLTVSDAGGAERGDGTRVMAVEAPAASGRLLVLRLDESGLRVEPLGDGLIARRKSVLGVGDSRGLGDGALLVWLMPEGDPAFDVAANLPVHGVTEDASDAERLVVSQLIAALEVAASGPSTGAAAVSLAR